MQPEASLCEWRAFLGRLRRSPQGDLTPSHHTHSTTVTAITGVTQNAGIYFADQAWAD